MAVYLIYTFYSFKFSASWLYFYCEVFYLKLNTAISLNSEFFKYTTSGIPIAWDAKAYVPQ